jgi:hypothetical protein
MPELKCEVRHRLEVPVGTPGSWNPWQSGRAFIWKDAEGCSVSCDSLAQAAEVISSLAFREHHFYKGDNLSAVKIEAKLEIKNVHMTFTYLCESD